MKTLIHTSRSRRIGGLWVILGCLLISTFSNMGQSFSTQLEIAPRPVFTSPQLSPPDSIRSFRSAVDVNKSEIIPVGEGIMLQPYYWKVPDDGSWWTTVEQYLPEFEAFGIDALWLPPAQKTPPGDVTTYGYEPYDYYDLGEFDQKGRIRTRYGPRTDLESLIQSANNLNIGAVADIVINHNNGGELEYDPYLDEFTYTDFSNVVSGRFPRNYSHFYPSMIYGPSDNLAWGDLPDLIHAHPYVHDQLLEYGEWLRDDIGYDGWRFDVAYGVAPEMMADWMNTVGGFGIAEFWNGAPITNSEIQSSLETVDYTTYGFDFPLMYEFRYMVMGDGGYDMRNLEDAGLMHLLPEDTLTFVANHDTHKDETDTVPYHREMGYAYILTHESYPMVFWKDYFDFNYHWHLQTLAEIREFYAKGTTSVLYTDEDCYVMQRNGDPGLILALNDNTTSWKSVTVTSKWTNTNLTDLTGQAPGALAANDGEVTLTIPPMGYAIFAPGSPVRVVPTIVDSGIHVPPTTVANAIIEIDGTYDYEWFSPIYADIDGDAGFRQRDLNNIYLTNDDDFLYLGIGVGKMEWFGAPIHIGISLDTIRGGHRYDPGWHSEIKFTGDNLPDFTYYAVLDNTSGYLAEVQNITKFVWDGTAWDNGVLVASENYASNSNWGLIELRIPLAEIGLTQGKTLRVMTYSTEEGKIGAMDSSPQSSEVDVSGDEESWLTMPNPLTLYIPPDDDLTTTTSTTTTEPSSTDTTDDPSVDDSPRKISGFPIILFMGLIGASFLHLLFRRRT